MVAENVYFLTEQNMTIGLLHPNSEIKDGYIFYSMNEKIEFKSFDDVEKKFGKLIFETSVYESTKTSVLNGYPIRHHKEIEQVKDDAHPNWPIYTTGGGKTVFAGGYWALRVKEGNRYGITWCPKLTTLLSGTYYGPFKTRLEALSESNIQNQRLESEYLEKIRKENE